MNKRHLDFNLWKKQAIKEPGLRKEYEKLQPEFALIKAIIEARKEKGLTQKRLAEKIGTKQSVISRLEIGRANPSFNFLKRLAQALNTRLEIKFAV
jgi:ribosome-binding protein aMBF1 (putative translation factor)